MKYSRYIIWFIAAVSYLSVFVALLHWLTNTWSGAASLGMLFAVVIGMPSLVGYAVSIWWQKRMHGLERVEAFVCFVFPAVTLLLAGLVVISEKMK